MWIMTDIGLQVDEFLSFDGQSIYFETMVVKTLQFFWGFQEKVFDEVVLKLINIYDIQYHDLQYCASIIL